MQRPPSILVLALVSAISGLVFLANTFAGNNWLTNSILSPPLDSQGLLPIANAIGKDLMLDVSPQLHPSVVVGESAKQIKFQHWIDNDIHCEDCLRLEIPNNGKKAGVAFSSSNGAVYNFEEAKKIRFYVMGEEAGAKINFKAVGNDKGNNAGGGMNNPSRNNNVSSNNLFTNQEFALASQNVTLNQTWSYFEMGLEGVQQKLGKVKYPFGLEVAQGKGQTTTIIYVKGISYSSEPVQERYLLEPSSGNTTASALAMPAATTTASLNITLRDNATETVKAPATVEFNATVSSGQEPYSFDWDFDDSATESDTDGNIVHSFATPGLYNVTVNVVDSMNNTGSANTLVDVAEGDEIVDDQPAIATEENSTQDSQPTTTGALNITNTTSPAADTDIEIEEEAADTNNDNSTGAADEEPPGVNEGTNTDDSPTNDTEATNNNTRNGVNSESNSGATNSPPIANAGNDLIGKPNEQVILDASKSSDPDAGDTVVSYQWEQESGPAAKINDQGSPTPIVTLPNVDEDSTIVFSLTANDGIVDSEEKDTVSIFVDFVDELTNNEQQRVLKPADITDSEWIASGDCEQQRAAECLSDGSDATFVSAGAESIDSVNLYSFGEFSLDGGGVGAPPVDPNSVVIDRVVAELSAKKIGNTGYVSFAVDDPRDEEHYFTPSLSIASSSFQNYNYVWDTNPVTGEIWTHDSLNSLVAGFKYDGGQSGVQISELQLTVSYHVPEPAPPADLGVAEEAGNSEASEENEENSTNGVQDADQEEAEAQEQQQQPAIETDSTDNSTRADADGEDGSESKE